MAIYFITLLNIINGAALRGSRVVLSLFAIQLGATALDIGMLIALSSLMQLFLGVYAGKASDRFGFRLPMIYGSVGGTLALLTPYLFPSLMGLYASRVLTGMTFIFFMVSLQNLAASLDGPEKRAANLTTYSLGQAISGLLGPIIIGIAIDHFGNQKSYLVLAIMATLPLLALGIFRKHVPGARERKQRGDSGQMMDLLRNPPLRRALLTGAVVFAASDLLSFYMPIYGHEIGLSATMIGVILGAHSAAAFVVRLVMPRLVKVASEETLMNWCLIASGMIYLLFPAVENPWVLIVVAFLLGLALGCGNPLSMILIYERAPEARTGEALGMRISINKIIQIVVPIGFGYVGAALGLIAVFWTKATILLASGIASRRAEANDLPRRRES
jgi:MFS family permease